MDQEFEKMEQQVGQSPQKPSEDNAPSQSQEIQNENDKNDDVKNDDVKNEEQEEQEEPQKPVNNKEKEKVYGYLKGGNGDVLSFTRKETIIGRNEKECHIKIKSQSVSAQHAIVRFVENGDGTCKCLLTDLFR